MNISINLNYAIAYIISGSIFMLGVFGIDHAWDMTSIVKKLEMFNEVEIFAVFIFVIIVSFFGLLFDAIRYSVCDKMIDWLLKDGGIDYSFFLNPDSEKTKEISDDYYTFYVLSLDLVVSLIILFVYNIGFQIMNGFNQAQLVSSLFILICAIFFMADSVRVRKEMKALMLKAQNNS